MDEVLLKDIYTKIKLMLEKAPEESECTDKENDILDEMQNLKEVIEQANVIKEQENDYEYK